MAASSGRVLGDRAEEAVALTLVRAGWRILGRNVRVGRGELDIVAVDMTGPTIVVVEVRRRGRRDFGLAEETVDWRKRRVLRRAIARLRDIGELPDGTTIPDASWRFDLVAVEEDRRGALVIRHHRGVAL
jgi:putative endonuclease